MSDEPHASPSLRRASGEDASAIRELVHDAYRDYTPLLGRTPIPMLVDYADAVHRHEFWVLVAGGPIVGLIELVPRDDHLWVENVAIAPAWQRRGLGRRLLAHAEDEARRRSFGQIGLLTNERYEDNIAMYARDGYRETHRSPHLGTDLIHFRKVLTV